MNNNCFQWSVRKFSDSLAGTVWEEDWFKKNVKGDQESRLGGSS